MVPETVVKWLHTGYPTRAKEFEDIHNLSNELKNVRTSIEDMAKGRTRGVACDMWRVTCDHVFRESFQTYKFLYLGHHVTALS